MNTTRMACGYPRTVGRSSPTGRECETAGVMQVMVMDSWIPEVWGKRIEAEKESYLSFLQLQMGVSAEEIEQLRKIPASDLMGRWDDD